MESGESGPPAPLVQRAGADADATRIAEALVAIWRDIDVALSPIIGARGVAALYKRSLYLTGAAHPWMRALHEGVHAETDLSALKSMLVQQSSAGAAAGGSALLETFHRLLVSLIGPSLTERLLRSIWANSSSGAPAQDTQR